MLAKATTDAKDRATISGIARTLNAGQYDFERVPDPDIAQSHLRQLVHDLHGRRYTDRKKFTPEAGKVPALNVTGDS